MSNMPSELKSAVANALSSQHNISESELKFDSYDKEQLLGGAKHKVTASAGGHKFEVHCDRMEGLAPEHQANAKFTVKNVKKL
jgi:hypothetical protein